MVLSSTRLLSFHILFISNQKSRGTSDVLPGSFITTSSGSLSALPTFRFVTEDSVAMTSLTVCYGWDGYIPQSLCIGALTPNRTTFGDSCEEGIKVK